MKKEANFGPEFRSWLKANPMPTSCYELKQTTTPLPFSAVKEHQINALLASKLKGKGILYKIPDDSRGVKPFDFFFMNGVFAWVVIKYQKKGFVFIDVETFVLESERSKRKSLTWERAKQIATIEEVYNRR